METMLNTMTDAQYRTRMTVCTRVIMKIIGRRFGADYAEEVAAEVMAMVVRRVLPTWTPERGNLDAYITTMAKNAAKNHLKAACNRKRANPVTDDEGRKVDPVDTLVDSGPTPFEAMARAGLADAIERLTERQRALLSAYLEHGSWGAAAAAIGVSGPTASRIKAEAIAALRAGL